MIMSFFFWWPSLVLVSLFFSFFSFSSIKNYSSTLLVVDISTSVLILFIFNFWSWPFCRSFICFQFQSLILIYQYYVLLTSFWHMSIILCEKNNFAPRRSSSTKASENKC
jgi:hypothetical protein